MVAIIDSFIAKLRGYNGNKKLRNLNLEVEFTQDQLEERIKCKLDPIYFIETYGRVISLDKGIIPFKLYDYQKKFIRILHKHRRIISMQPRQMGKSQVVAAYILWYIIFHPAKEVAILANKAAAAREIMSRLQMMYEELPIWMQHGIKTWNKGDIELENGSKVFTAATSKGGIRGKSINLLYVDEVAIIPNNVAEDFFTSVYPTISSGQTTQVVLTSTPLGYNHFWKFWNEAITLKEGTNESLNGFTPLKVEYWENPNRDQKWADDQLEILGELKFTQEVLCSFLGSSATLLNSDTIHRLSPTNPIYSKDGIDILEQPKERHSYVLVADTSKGVGGDYSAFVVIDVTQMPYIMVAKYRNNKIDPMLYPNVIYKIATEYNQASVLIEINSSEQVPQILYSDLEYENLLMVSRGKNGQFIGGGFSPSSKMGVNTDKKVKRLGCSTLKSIMERNQLIVTDLHTIQEFSTFIEVKGSYEADEGYHDDLVMCLVLFAWLTTNTYFKDLCDYDMRNVLYAQTIQQLEDELTPIGYFNDGREDLENPYLNF